MGHFKKLMAWQHARTLAVLSDAAIKRLPAYEHAGLADQWRRAAYSVVLNIAEGASRPGRKEFRRFLGIARSSLDEIEAIVDLATAFSYVSGEEAKALEDARDECSKTLYGLMRKLDDPPRPS